MTTRRKKTNTGPSSRRAKPEEQDKAIVHPEIGRRATLLEGNWLELAKAFGGVNELAAAIGVHYSTVNRWALHDANIPAATRQLIRILSAQKGVAPPV